MDRDVVASMNIAYKGWARFTHPRGLPVEAMKGNVGLFEPLILSRWKQVGDREVVHIMNYPSTTRQNPGMIFSTLN
ncbi:MAG: hypothetical protein ABI337_00060 [Nitrososphaera sp.]